MTGDITLEQANIIIFTMMHDYGTTFIMSDSYQLQANYQQNNIIAYATYDPVCNIEERLDYVTGATYYVIINWDDVVIRIGQFITKFYLDTQDTLRQQLSFIPNTVIVNIN